VSPILDSLNEVRFSTVFLVSIIVLGTLVVVWLLLPDLAMGPTPVQVSKRTDTVSKFSAAPISQPRTAKKPEVVIQESRSPEAEVVSGSSQEKSAPTNPGVAESRIQKEPVSIQPVQAELASSRAKPTRVAGLFLLQVGAFGKPEAAQARLEELRNLEFEPRFETSSVEGKEITRVVVGPFETREQAAQAQTVLKTAGLDSFLRKLN
jgi:DedD protein